MSFTGGETLQLSFGPAANAVTSHLCNLQGLASTNTTSGGDNNNDNNNNSYNMPLCDPYITHAIHKETYVPRVLFVDGRNHFSEWPTSAMDTATTTNASATARISSSDGQPSLVQKHFQKIKWEGDVEVHHRLPFNQNHNHNTDSLPSSSSFNSNNQNLHNHFIDTNIQQNPFL